MNEFYFPMKAYGGDLKTAEPYWEDPLYIVQRKEDGARYIAHHDLKGDIRIYSRQLSKATGLPVLKTEQLRHIAASVGLLTPRGSVLDGEVCAPGKSRFNLVTKATGAAPEKALEYQIEHGFLEYHVFDVLVYDGYDQTQEALSTRLVILEDLFEAHKLPYVSLLPWYTKNKKQFFDSLIADGYEGVILKDLGAPYYQNKRHRTAWVKAKRQSTYDVIFTGVELAEEMTVKKGQTEATRSRIAGLPGAITFSQYVEVKHGGVFEPEWSGYELHELGTVSGFDDELRLDLAKNWEKYVAEQRVFEIIAQERFPNGRFQSPRWSQWRPDRTADTCIYRPEEG